MRPSSAASLAVAAASLCGSTPAAHAQAAAPPARQPIELGVDGSFGATFSDDATVVGLGVPNTRLRANFFLGDRLSLEPSVGLQAARASQSFETAFQSGPGSVTVTRATVRQTTVALDADLGLLVHLGGTPRRPGALETRPYLRPFVGLQTLRVRTRIDGTSGFVDPASSRASSTQARVGFGLGVRRRLADRLALRLEGLAARTTGSDSDPLASTTGITVPASTSVGVAFGLSFFTR